MAAAAAAAAGWGMGWSGARPTHHDSELLLVLLVLLVARGYWSRHAQPGPAGSFHAQSRLQATFVQAGGAELIAVRPLIADPAHAADPVAVAAAAGGVWWGIQLALTSGCGGGKQPS